MDLEQAVAMLMDQPFNFLSTNALSIAGGSTLTSGLRRWKLTSMGTAHMSVSGPGWTGTKGIQSWRASVTGDDPAPVLTRGMMGTTEFAEFRAYYVAMRQLGESTDTTHFVLPAQGGPDLMLTSQLSGCTFGYGSQGGGGCLVSHIQPAGSGDGKRAPGALTEIGKKALGHAVSGPLGTGATILETSGAEKITVIGQRAGGVWMFYKQEGDGSRIINSAALF